MRPISKESRDRLKLAIERSESCVFMAKARVSLLDLLAQDGLGSTQSVPCENNNRVAYMYIPGVKLDYSQDKIEGVGIIGCVDCIFYQIQK